MDIPQTVSTGLAAPAQPRFKDRRGKAYEPALGPRLKILLAVLFAGVAVLGASGFYLFALSAMNQSTGKVYTSYFSLWMILVHTLVGVVTIVPFLIFGFVHLATARNRPNRRAVRLGIVLFITGIIVCATGLALVQVHDKLQLPTGTIGRWVVYILHVVAPIGAVGLYVAHRRAGPDLKWQWGAAWGVGVAGFVGAMGLLHAFNPHSWGAVGSPEGVQYFAPSEAVTADGKFIPADTLMMDSYCLKCHKDTYNDWFHSAHHFSSFNNPPYLFSVRETRKVSKERDGNLKAARWCAGCHDPVPFFSGQFDDPDYDDVNHPTSQAGITCTACHAITNVNSTIGNAAYTIEEPQHYPFAKSDNPVLQWINNQMIKAKPDFHKQTFLKPVMRTTEFCSTCHKVSLPMELNHYKDFLRGQNHHDTYHLSGVSGHNARAFYYPPEAKTRCAECHMPLAPSGDFGSRDFDESGVRKRHSHTFPGSNTGLPTLLSLDPKKADEADGFRKMADLQADFLKDKKLRIDLFGLKKGDGIDAELIAPLRPELPALKRGQTYVVEVVVRTLNVGHPFSQGTVDSNEIWVDFEAKSGGKVIGRNGALSGPDDTGAVDEWAHYANVHMLDRNGHRINRRNPQDIFTPLYDHQIPPGAAHVVHYRLDVPADAAGPVELRVRLRYRKFDFEYMSLVYGGADKVPKIPIIDLCADSVTLPVEGVQADEPAQTSPIQPAWQRWNDYGIGFFLTASSDPKRPGLRQAEDAFGKLAALPDKDPRAHGHLNLARSYVLEGNLPRALAMLNTIREEKLPAPWWTVAWFTGLVNAQNGHLDEAIESFQSILDPKNQPRERNFDFGSDYVVLDELGKTLFQRSQQELEDRAARDRFLQRAVATLEVTLKLDQEDLEAHYLLKQCYGALGQEAAPPPDQAPSIEAAAMMKLAALIADTSKPREERQIAAGQLGRAVIELGEQPPRPQMRRLALFQQLLVACRKVFHEDGDPAIQAATAQVLARLHGAVHSLLIPDANAKDFTVSEYRKTHKAADAASQAIVIYPTDPSHGPARAAKGN